MKARPSGKFNKIQKQALDNEIERQIEEWKANNLTDYELAVLWALHNKYDFDAEKLKEFWDFYQTVPKMMQDKYEGIGTVDFIAHQELKKIGVNIYEWRNDKI